MITKCEDCGRTTQRARGEEIDVDAATAEWAECDAQRIDLNEPGVPHAKQNIPPATRRFVLLRDHHRCVVHACRNSTSSTFIISTHEAKEAIIDLAY